MSKDCYLKLKGVQGVYKHKQTGHFLARKKKNGVSSQRTFVSLHEAKQWLGEFKETKVERTFEAIMPITPIDGKKCSTLAHVWATLQKIHFPTLATSTKDIWLRRYDLLRDLEHLPMNYLSPSVITTWVNKHVAFFKTDEYQGSGRGKAGRCNLSNELNLLVTIFNWYKDSEQFEKEAYGMNCPVLKKHRKLGFIKSLPDKKKQIDVKSAYLFFDFLPSLYRDLAMMQFYCAGRIGEICGMQWSNIDLPNRRLIIKHTCVFDMANKTFVELKPFPKNKEIRPVFITDEIYEILLRREKFKIDGNDYVYHVEGKPINYGNVQLNYRTAQRKSGIPYTGTHILRHGMAKLARQVGGGLDAVMAMTGHKDIKLANHYSKCDEDDQKLVSEKIMNHLRNTISGPNAKQGSFENVVSLKAFKNAINE